MTFSSSSVATVLTVYGIETLSRFQWSVLELQVATVLTVYGIETDTLLPPLALIIISLQQYLPFTVLKHELTSSFRHEFFIWLQQYLPFTVLKQAVKAFKFSTLAIVATVLTVYGIETAEKDSAPMMSYSGSLQQYLPFTVLKLLTLQCNET